MIRNKLLQESLNDLFKKQTLNDVQKENIHNCLKNSRYSKLSYNNSSSNLSEYLLEKINKSPSCQLSDVTYNQPNEEKNNKLHVPSVPRIKEIDSTILSDE